MTAWEESLFNGCTHTLQPQTNRDLQSRFGREKIIQRIKLKTNSEEKPLKVLIAFEVRERNPYCVGRSVHYWVTCAINKGGFSEILFSFVVVVDTHLPRFEALS